MENTDKQIFETFMSWMGMKEDKTIKNGDNDIISYTDTFKCKNNLSKIGYDEFFAGAEFDKNGNIVKAYLDSHNAYVSENCEEISKTIKTINNKQNG